MYVLDRCKTCHMHGTRTKHEPATGQIKNAMDSHFGWQCPPACHGNSAHLGLTQASDNPTRESKIANPVMFKSGSSFPDSRRTLVAFSRCGQWPSQHSSLCFDKTNPC